MWCRISRECNIASGVIATPGCHHQRDARHARKQSSLGSRLNDIQSENSTVAASATAERKTLGIGHEPCGDPAPILEPSEYDLDAVAPFVASLVVFHLGLALLSTGDAGLYLFVFQRISEPVRVITTICNQPVGIGQLPQQGRRASLIADLSG
jgi:hypothetical protein